MTAQLNLDIELAFKDFSLALKFSLNSEITVLSGASGSGKSTLLNCIAGLQKPDKGIIQLSSKTFFDFEKSINLRPQERRCAYVVQSLALFPHLNVSRNICYGMKEKTKAAREKRLAELLSIVKLNGLENRLISELSGGQAQRVALARALAPDPELLLLDEAFNALDPELREELGEQLKVLQRSLKIPVLIVSHSKSEAMRLGDTFIVLEAGRLQSIQSKADRSSGSLIDSDSLLSW
ncbi:MAG: ATP-binding cassette domain-containing protein [Candidatus Obscuribacterales bacterium]|nr:ATP-binding cassette domain-containing protein [Candidatus Obscuribacterales bacterium]